MLNVDIARRDKMDERTLQKTQLVFKKLSWHKQRLKYYDKCVATLVEWIVIPPGNMIKNNPTQT